MVTTPAFANQEFGEFQRGHLEFTHIQEDVKGSVGRVTPDAGDAFEPLHEEPSASIVFFHHLADTVLWAFQGGHACLPGRGVGEDVHGAAVFEELEQEVGARRKAAHPLDALNVGNPNL